MARPTSTACSPPTTERARLVPSMRDDLDKRLADVGELIKSQREVARMSVRRLAELAGVSNPYLSQIERGLRKPSADILQQIAKALQISAESLYERAGFLPPDRQATGRRPRSHRRRPAPDRRATQALLNVYESFVAAKHLRPRAPRSRNVDLFGSVSHRRATCRRPLAPHVAARPTRVGRQWRHERVRARAGLGAGPGRCRVHDLHPGDAARTCPRSCRSSPATVWCTSPPGRTTWPRSSCPSVLDEFGDGVVDHLKNDSPADVLHANYWLSGLVAHRIKHELDLPFVSTFHTLAKVKAEGGDLEPEWRERAEAEIIGCADAICVSCTEEERQFRRLYGDPAGRIEIVAPGVEHAFFAPGDRAWRAQRARPAGRRAGAAVRRPHPAAEGPRRRRARPRRAEPARRAAADRRRRQRTGGRRRDAATLQALDRPSSASRTRCASSRRSRTTSSAPTTAPPTSCSCRAAARASASSPSRRRRAASPSWPAASAGC